MREFLNMNPVQKLSQGFTEPQNETENIFMMKLPPIEKNPEAYSAIADRRLEFSEQEPEAYITSFDRAGRYMASILGSVKAEF